MRLKLLDTNEHDIQFRLLWNPHVPTQIWDAAVTHPDEHVRSLVADNWYAPPEQRARLVEDPDASVRIATAQGPTPFRQTADPLPLHALATLAQDPDPRVRKALAERRETPPETRRTLCTDESPLVRATAIAAWPNPPDDITDLLLDDPDDEVRLAVSMRRCATSAHLGLRRAAAYSPHLPPDLVDTLAEDDDFIVRLLLTENHPSPPSLSKR